MKTPRWEKLPGKNSFWRAHFDAEHVDVTVSRERSYGVNTLRPHSNIYKWVLGCLSDMKAESVRILDLGCGSGYGVEMLQGAGHSVAGIDICPEAVRFGQLSLPDCEFATSSMTDIPFDDGSFDVAVAVDTIEHVEDDEGAIVEIKRVLKPGGFLYLSTPDIDTKTKFGLGIAPHHIREYDATQVRALLSSNGFRVVHMGVVPEIATIVAAGVSK